MDKPYDDKDLESYISYYRDLATVIEESAEEKKPFDAQLVYMAHGEIAAMPSASGEARTERDTAGLLPRDHFGFIDECGNYTNLPGLFMAISNLENAENRQQAELKFYKWGMKHGLRDVLKTILASRYKLHILVNSPGDTWKGCADLAALMTFVDDKEGEINTYVTSMATGFTADPLLFLSDRRVALPESLIHFSGWQTDNQLNTNARKELMKQNLDEKRTLVETLWSETELKRAADMRREFLDRTSVARLDSVFRCSFTGRELEQYGVIDECTGLRQMFMAFCNTSGMNTDSVDGVAKFFIHADAMELCLKNDFPNAMYREECNFTSFSTAAEILAEQVYSTTTTARGYAETHYRSFPEANTLFEMTRTRTARK